MRGCGLPAHLGAVAPKRQFRRIAQKWAVVAVAVAVVVVVVAAADIHFVLRTGVSIAVRQRGSGAVAGRRNVEVVPSQCSAGLRMRESIDGATAAADTTTTTATAAVCQPEMHCDWQTRLNGVR